MDSWEICKIVLAPNGEVMEGYKLQDYLVRMRHVSILARLLNILPKKPLQTVWWEVRQATVSGESVIAKSNSFEFDDETQRESKFSSLIAQLASQGWEPFAVDKNYNRIDQMKRLSLLGP